MRKWNEISGGLLSCFLTVSLKWCWINSPNNKLLLNINKLLHDPFSAMFMHVLKWFKSLLLSLFLNWLFCWELYFFITFSDQIKYTIPVTEREKIIIYESTDLYWIKFNILHISILLLQGYIFKKVQIPAVYNLFFQNNDCKRIGPP